MTYNTIKLEQNLKMKFIFTMFLSLLCRARFGYCFGAVFHRLVRVMLTFRTRQCTAAARYLFRRPRFPTGGAPHPGRTRRCGTAQRSARARELLKEGIKRKATHRSNGVLGSSLPRPTLRMPARRATIYDRLDLDHLLLHYWRYHLEALRLKGYLLHFGKS